jgi:hypothetical protein
LSPWDVSEEKAAGWQYVVLGAIFAGGAFHDGFDEVLYLLFAASVIAVGVAGATLSHREGRYSPT